MTTIDSVTNATLDSMTIVKNEPFDQDLCDMNESTVYYVTENPSCTRRKYKCERCGHMNAITPSSEDGFIDSSQSVATSSSSTFHVSIDPESLQLRNNPLPLQSRVILSNDQNDSRNDVYTSKKKKRLVFPGDVGDDEQLGDETAQKYISVLRKTVMDQRRQTKTLAQQNRRQQQRINKLKTLLKDLVEKTKNGNYIIEPSS